MADNLKQLEVLQRNRTKEISLGPRPGERIRSGVVVPSRDEKKMVDLDDL